MERTEFGDVLRHGGTAATQPTLIAMVVELVAKDEKETQF